MPKTLVLFYSRTGHTAVLAESIAEGARSVRFAEVSVRRVPELRAADADTALPEEVGRHPLLEEIEELATYDALLVGAPTRYGVMAAELKALLDRTGPLWKAGALAGKIGSAFTSVSTPHGGHETTLWSIMTVMANLGMILVPPGYTDPAAFRGGSPFGATATTGSAVGGPTPDDLTLARHQGRRVAQVAGWVTHARSHEHDGAHHPHH